jgi:hypothetical protein
MNKQSFFLVFFSLTLISSCATKPQWELKGKSSTAKKDSLSPDESAEESLKNPSISLAESQTLSELYKKLLKGMPEQSDAPVLRGLVGKSERSSLEEAALALYVLQAFIEQEKAHEKLLTMGEPSEFKAEKFLARLCAFVNIDLIHLIQENNFLQTIDSYKLLAKINSSRNQETRSTNLARAIEGKFIQLHDFALLNNPLSSGTFSDAEETRDSQGTSNSDLAEGRVEEAKDSSAVIIERVDNLLASNKFFEAINLLKEIEEEEDLYNVAQEKVGKISTRAVNGLRKKAATYFRQANQLNTDAKAREVYLAQAKTTLQVALDLYPKAQQVTRVQRDLKIIDDNLRFINKGRLEKR